MASDFILTWAVVFGLALRGLASDSTKTVLQDVSNAISTAVRWVIELAPFGILGLVFNNVSTNGLEIFTSYGRLLALLVGKRFGEMLGHRAEVFGGIILILIGMLMGPLLRVPKPERKFYQLMTIFNNMGFIGYPVVNAVIGPEGMGFAALFNLGFNLLLFTYGIVLLRQGQVRVNWKTFLNAGTLSALLAKSEAKRS